MRAFWASSMAWGLHLQGIFGSFGSFERFLVVEKWRVRIVKRDFEMGMTCIDGVLLGFKDLEGFGNYMSFVWRKD